MMKKLIVIATILILVIVPTTVFAQSGSQVLVYPLLDEINATTEDELILHIGWGACTPGLVKAWTNAAYYQWYIDDSPILTADEAQDYWGPIESRGPNENCLIGDGDLWVSLWDYSIGSLPAGDYVISLIYGTNHKMIDGGDYDGDGHFDFLGYWEHSVTVHVAEP
jgi:hypothetical protein